MHGRSLHSLKVTVLCAVSKKCIIGSYFFEEQENISPVDKVRYVDMLNNFIPSDISIQQDAAPSHTAIATMNNAREMFPGRFILRFEDVHCSFLLLGYLT